MEKPMTTLKPKPSADILSVIGHMDGLMFMGDTLVKSGMLPQSIKTKEAAVAVILKGRELGIGPMEAFSSIHVIQGKPTISPQLMMALAERSGQLEDCTVEDDGDVCKVTVKRRGRTPHTASFSMDDAKAMGLLGKQNWKTMPRVMRQWRAISAAFRPTFADVLAGLYTPEEMGATIDAEGVINVEETELTPLPAETPKSPWIECDEGMSFHSFFDKAKVNLGEDEYYAVLGLNGCGHRSEIHTREQAMAIVKTFRAQGCR